MDTRIKEWANLKYIVPAIVLPQLYLAQIEILNSSASEALKSLRTNSLKHNLEKRAAALFCFGISNIIKNEVSFTAAPRQNVDYDIVARYQDVTGIHYIPIQIKEVVPPRINPEANLNSLIEKLSKYPKSSDITVVIQDNTKGLFRLADIKVPHLNIAALWILGCCNTDQSEWFIAGDILRKDAQIYKFSYPR